MRLKARERYVLMSADYSQQEPKILAQMCGDENMLESFRQGQDIYAKVASVSFHTTYENCLEFFPKGTPIRKNDGKWELCSDDEAEKHADGVTDTNKAGKERRKQAKSVLLGITYGRGDESIAEQLGCSLQEAKDIKARVFNGFPTLLKFEEESKRMAIEDGFVTTLWGRKRRLPDLRLPEYSVSYINRDPVPPIYAEPWLYRLKHKARWYSDRQKIIAEALEKEGIIITSNFFKKSQAERQVVNSRIQGKPNRSGPLSI